MTLSFIKFSDRKIIILSLLIVSGMMLVNVFHPYLWGPDEPRVAEIARETFINGNYVTPYFCNLPFIEKPPLYFNMIAASYAVLGDITPGNARLVSTLAGCVMLAIVFITGYYWQGRRTAVFSVLLLITMPQFYRTSHWILGDIGVGAFCSVSLWAFLYHHYWTEGKKVKWPLYLFYFAAACAFLTKGVIGIFHIVVVIGVFALLLRRWNLIKVLISPLPMLMFIVPVGIWIYLFYCEGGIYFLHEHFINNILGRFLHIKFKINGNSMPFTDIGNSSPWYFYLKRFPAMFGGVIAIIPFIIWEFLRLYKLLPAGWIVYADQLKNNRKKIWDFLNILFMYLLNGSKNEEPDSKHKEIFLFLFLWSFLPIFLLSFSSIKEVTYIIPSYAGIALLGAYWLDQRLEDEEKIYNGLLIFSAIVMPVLLTNIFVTFISLYAYVLIIGLWLSAWILVAVFILLKKYFNNAAFMILGIVAGSIVLGNTPELMRKTRLNRKCYIDMASYVFNRIGEKSIYIFRGGETLRGSLPFYGKRMIPVLHSKKQIRDILRTEKGETILFVASQFKRMVKDKDFVDIIRFCEVHELPHSNLNESYVIVSSPSKE